MASPLRAGKQSVDLSAPSRVSRIRRDPPPAARKVALHDRNERDRRNGVIGIIAFALAILVITVGLGSAAGWSPSQYSITLAEPSR
jgi:hypothetical protein